MGQIDWSTVFAYVFGTALVSTPLLIGAFRKAEEKSFMRAMAQRLGLAYEGTPGADFDRPPGLVGGQILDVLSGTHSGMTVGAFTYRVLIGGKQKYWSFMSVFKAPLPRTLPDMVVQPNTLLGLDGAANMAVARTSLVGNYEKIALEGDFGKYFTLWAEKGNQILAREVFTPDIMAEMMDTYRSYGVEFYKSNLYLYPMKLIEDDANFTRGLTLVEELSKLFSPALSAMPAEETPAATPAETETATAGVSA